VAARKFLFANCMRQSTATARLTEFLEGLASMTDLSLGNVGKSYSVAVD